MKSLSCVRLFSTLWTVAQQARPSMGFSRQEYWTGLPFPSPGDLPHPGIELRSPTLQADALTSEPPVCMLSKFSSVQLFETLWTIAHQALLSMEFSRQEYWSEFHSLLQGISPTQGSNPSLLCLLHCRQILYHWATGKAHSFFTENKISREPWLLPLLPSRHQNSPWKLPFNASLSTSLPSVHYFPFP